MQLHVKLQHVLFDVLIEQFVCLPDITYSYLDALSTWIH